MENNGKIRRLIKDLGIFALGSLGSKLILFFLLPLYTNYMTDAEYGTADLVLTVGQLVMPFVSVVIFDAVIRFGLAKSVDRQDVLLNALLVCTTGAIATLMLTPALSLYAAIAQWKWLLAAYVISSMFNSTLMAYLKVKDRNKTYSILSVVQTGVLAGLNVYLLCIVHAGIDGYLLSIVVAASLTAVLAFAAGGVWGDLRSASFKRPLLKEMLLYSSPLILNNVSWWAIQSADKILLEAMVGAAALGIFTVASKIPSLINVMISIFSQAWGLSSVREYEESNDSEFYSSVFNTYQLIAFGAAILLIAITKPFMAIYVGEEFSEAWRFVPLLLVSASFSAVSSYYGSLYSALKKSVNNMATTAFAAIINILISFVGIHFFGVWGAVLGTFSSYVVIAIARLVDVGRFIAVQIDVRSFVGNIALAVIEAAAVSFEIWTIPVSLICIVVYLGINWHYFKRFRLLRK